MGGVERIGQLCANLDETRCWNRLATVQAIEGLSLQQFHDQERLAFGLADLVDGAYARMIER